MDRRRFEAAKHFIDDMAGVTDSGSEEEDEDEDEGAAGIIDSVYVRVLTPTYCRSLHRSR